MYIWFPDKIPWPLPVGINSHDKGPLTRSLSVGSRQDRTLREFYPVSAYHSKSILIQCVGRASDATTTAIEYMGIDHRCFHILVAEQILNCTDIVAILKQMRGK